MQRGPGRTREDQGGLGRTGRTRANQGEPQWKSGPGQTGEDGPGLTRVAQGGPGGPWRTEADQDDRDGPRRARTDQSRPGRTGADQGRAGLPSTADWSSINNGRRSQPVPAAVVVDDTTFAAPPWSGCPESRVEATGHQPGSGNIHLPSYPILKDKTAALIWAEQFEIEWLWHQVKKTRKFEGFIDDLAVAVI